MPKIPRRVGKIIFSIMSSKLYRGTSTFSSNCVGHWDGKRFYRGTSTFSSDTLFSFDGKRVYRGTSTFSSDTMFTVDGMIPIAVIAAMVLNF